MDENGSYHYKWITKLFMFCFKINHDDSTFNICSSDTVVRNVAVSSHLKTKKFSEQVATWAGRLSVARKRSLSALPKKQGVGWGVTDEQRSSGQHLCKNCNYFQNYHIV